MHLHDDAEQAFNDMFYAYKDKLYGCLLGLTHSEVEAEDVVQNVNAYLFCMAQNDIIDASRRFVCRKRCLDSMLAGDNPLKSILEV